MTVKSPSTPDDTWPEPLMVVINGVEYPTQLYNGVQRFVSDPAVEILVKRSIEASPLIHKPAENFYHAIPDELKSLTHSNSVVNFFVEKNKESYFGINELTIALHYGEVSIEDFIVFETLHGWSVSGYYDSVSQKLENLDLDVDEYFVLENPLWE